MDNVHTAFCQSGNMSYRFTRKCCFDTKCTVLDICVVVSNLLLLHHIALPVGKETNHAVPLSSPSFIFTYSLLFTLVSTQIDFVLNYFIHTHCIHIPVNIQLYVCVCVYNIMQLLQVSLCMQYRGNTHSKFSRNSEAFASEILEKCILCSGSEKCNKTSDIITVVITTSRL